MRFYAVMLILVSILCSCGNDAPFSIQVMPAILVEDPQQPPATGWTRIDFSGSYHTAPGLYDVAPDTLLTEWNIISYKAASPTPDKHSVIIRLNIYAQQKMEKFSNDAAHLKQPLGVKIDGRWADFIPLLGPINDRLTLTGFTSPDLVRLKSYIDTK